jgi:hypothetical protein
MATINTKSPGDCGYVGIYNRQQIEFYAPSLYAAKQQAVKYFRPPKSKEHMVSVYLAERQDGTEVTHTPSQ